MSKGRQSNAIRKPGLRTGLRSTTQMTPLRTPADQLRYENSVEGLLERLREAEAKRMADVKRLLGVD